MTSYDMTTDRVIFRAAADTDCTILIHCGKAYAMVEETPDEDGCIGYMRPIGDRDFVANPYDGYRWWVEDGSLHSAHVTRPAPAGREDMHVSDGSQELVFMDDDIADLIAASYVPA